MFTGFTTLPTLVTVGGLTGVITGVLTILVLLSWPAGSYNLLPETSPKPAGDEVAEWVLMGWLVGVGSVVPVWLLGWTW